MYKILIASKISIYVENLFLINAISLYTTIYLNIFINTFKIFLLNLCYIYSLVEFIIEILTTIYIDLSATIKTKKLINLII